jgi:D-alanyl-D-alanine carboxypeptidase
MRARMRSAIRIFITAVLAAVLFCSAIVPVFGADAPEITSSKSALLYCMESETVMFATDKDLRLSPGVLTKLMVAVVTIEEVANRGLTLDSVFTATKEIINKTKGKHISMKNGENFRVRDLIAAIIHTDADDAAYVLAESPCTLGTYLTTWSSLDKFKSLTNAKIDGYRKSGVINQDKSKEDSDIHNAGNFADYSSNIFL